jgi:preprotein translocase subunit SecA
MKKYISNIKIESTKLIQKTDDELHDEIDRLKKRSTIEPLENLIPKWFALVQEISFRELGLRHFDTQLMAGFFLHQGKIVEMKTGEGKTLASTLPVSLNALTKKGVHVVTVNDYLAERDQKWMSKIYKKLGLECGLVKSTSSIFSKKKSYAKDITYVTNSELVFDFLRDSSAVYSDEMVQKPFNYCVIDEIDSILIDEARTPLILSSSKGITNKNKLSFANFIATILIKEEDFQIDEKRREINLTEKGYKKTKEILGKKSLYEEDDPWILEILNALKALYIFKLNKDYIILNNKVLIVDEFTGRIMEDRRWSLGIHEAIEIKEKVPLREGTQTKTSITYQNFFTLYPKLAGMTGTAKTTEKEFQDIYKLDVVVIPTFKPLIRKDCSDLVYQTELAKWKSVLNTAKNCFEKGQPILIGTSSVEKSEFLSELFRISKLPHQVLNAKPENVARESEIIAQAGKKGAITIATNMAGRGTDIILGGNIWFELKQKIFQILFENIEIPEKYANLVFELKKEYEEKKTLENLEKDVQNLPYSLEDSLSTLQNLYNELYKELYPIWQKENNFVKQVGGLFVLGTERHETRRIDNQLRGRAGRQGDEGVSQFFVSLEDELIKVFGGDSIKKWVDYLIQEKDVPLESELLTKSLENAQKKVELYNYELRKNVFQYDDILNNQRKQLFQARTEILAEINFHEFMLRTMESLFDDISSLETNNFIETKNEFFERWFDSYSFYSKNSIINSSVYEEIWISNDLRFSSLSFYQPSFLKKNRTINVLSLIDFHWTEHLERMNSLRETINWKAYGQQNPLVEYNLGAFKSFENMFDQIRSYMLYSLLIHPINS